MKKKTSALRRRGASAVLLLAFGMAALGVQAAEPAPSSTPAPARPASSPAPAPVPAKPASAPGTGQVVQVLVPTPGAVAASAPELGAPEIKPYDKVITAEAKTQPGLFKIHTIKSKLYFEIPKALLDKPLLMVATATAVPALVDHVGRELHQEVVRFGLKNNKLYFQSVSHAYVSDPNRAIAAAVQDSQRDAILTALQVEAYGKDGAPVVEVSRLFTTEIGDFTARVALRATGLDSSRSYIERSKAFPASLRIDAVHTYGFAAMPTVIGMPVMPMPPARSGSVDVAYNIVQLPEVPMMPRLMDDRVGFFGLERVDFGSPEHGSKRERLIARWRLEKKDPAASLSEPVKPVVWYIDKATPEWLVPYVKKGVEAWNVAFEAAGFRNAIQARPYPSKEEDPEFDPEDVRYSVIRWVPSMIPNAYGPHLSDPRSGEILNADVVIYHNIMQLQRDWYVTQAGAVDPRAQTLPLPDALMGDLVAFVVTHEIGHALGFPHNMKASSLYPTAKLRDAKWLQEMGHVPTLMDYARFNYLVQPEDKIDPALLIPRIGPYDVFATHWGYTPIPSARTPQEELPILQTWIREQDSKPWLRFSAVKLEGEYGELTEAVGDADAVLATTWGIKNLQRIVKQVPKLAVKADQDDRTLEDLYNAIWAQWTRELGHVLAIVGGYESQNKHGDQPGAVFQALPRERQARAVKLINEQLFNTPTWLFEPTIVERLRPSEPSQRLLTIQRGMLRALLDRGRTGRMQQQLASLGGSKAYAVEDLLQDLRAGLFLSPAAGRLTAARRGLQSAYLEQLIQRAGGAVPGLADDARAPMRAELKSLKSLFAAKAASTADRTGKAHWEDLYDTASRALDPRATQVAAPAMTVVIPRGLTGEADDNICWPENP